MTGWLRHVALAVALLAVMPVVAAPPAHAEGKGSQGKKAAPKPSDVPDLPGDYFQLETVWVPVIGAAGHPLYQGMMIRMWPAPDKRYEACVATPHIEEDLISWFNDNPIDLDTYSDTAKMAERITRIAEKRVGPDVFAKIEVFHEFLIPDRDSELISRACK